MTEEKLDFLALYAGLDIPYPTTGKRGAPIYRAISCVFKKVENALTFFQP